MFELAAQGGISHVIQLAVAPVFLLAGVGAILNVMANRLSRIIDRARVLETKLGAAAEDAAREDLSARSPGMTRSPCSPIPGRRGSMRGC
jgi:hypothetical protein